MDKIAVLVPCYNESKTVQKVVEDFKRVLPEAIVYVYDNNSSDGTDKIAREAGAVVRYEHQQGKGSVIRRMFREIDAEVYLVVDGDDTYPAEAAPEMVRKIREERSDMVVGDRLSSTYYTENKRPFHNFGNTLVKNCINRFFDTNIQDIMTGYRAFNYQFVKTFPVLSKGFEIETEMSIHAADKHMQVDNVVIDYRDRPEGSVSKLNTFSDGFKVLTRILNLYKNYKPLSFFSLLALILMVLGCGFLIPVLVEYFETGLVPKFPTLIVCCFVLIAGLQSFFAGLVLQSMEQKNKQDFEMQLLQARNVYESLRKQ
ncbi:MAG: glycosyltransferase [Lachnospiraceae bacterium]|jgi:glycosyltransferase involved in cell wall biosynthesis|nr:glycosyltransferase [Lachnospiraceae bacterium]